MHFAFSNISICQILAAHKYFINEQSHLWSMWWYQHNGHRQPMAKWTTEGYSACESNSEIPLTCIIKKTDCTMPREQCIQASIYMPLSNFQTFWRPGQCWGESWGWSAEGEEGLPCVSARTFLCTWQGRHCESGFCAIIENLQILSLDKMLCNALFRSQYVLAYSL